MPTTLEIMETLEYGGFSHAAGNGVIERPFISKAIPFLRTKTGKIYLMLGIAVILIVILGIGFLLYTVR